MVLNPKAKLHIFIGYEDRLPLQYLACKESILQTTNPEDVSIIPLKHRTLRELGLFWRPWMITKTGITKDLFDDKPFSTNFAFTRFLVPHYSRLMGCESGVPALFHDSDFIWLSSPLDILRELDVRANPVWCVKHNYKPETRVKMDGQLQFSSPRKLWSSLMLFNTASSLFDFPSVAEVNTKPGSWLHGFEWLEERRIGEINERWNFIPNHSETRVDENNIGAIHYTEGSPDLVPNCKFAHHYDWYLKWVLTKSVSDLDYLRKE